jgi:hypoxanthine phosphoribosyltransferase
MVPACFLAQLTDHRLIDTFCIWSYTGEKPTLPTHTQKNFEHLEGKRVLLIDDLVDTGATMESALYWIKRWNPSSVLTAVIVKKAGSNFTPDFWVQEAPEGQWIDFPWEINRGIKLNIDKGK